MFQGSFTFDKYILICYNIYMKFLIYKATNKESGKCYIGKTSNGLKRRKREHFATARLLSKISTIFHRALNSYGPNVFEWEVLEDCIDHAHLNDREMFHINQNNSLAPNGYNMTAGGDGMYGYTIPPEVRLKISNSVSQLHQDPEYTANLYPKLKGLTPPNKGVPMSSEQKAKISAAKKAVYADPTYINPNKGQVRTEEQKANIKAGQKGKMASGAAWQSAHKDQYTDEVRAKMRAKKLGKKPANTKQVQCIETGIIYSGLSEASTALKINRQSIWLQIKGKLKHAGGKTFRYKT